MPTIIPSYQLGTLTTENLDNSLVIARMYSFISRAAASGLYSGMSFMPSPQDHVNQVGTIPTLDESRPPCTWAIPGFGYPGYLALTGGVAPAGKLTTIMNRMMSSSARQFYAEPSRQGLRVPNVVYYTAPPKTFNMPSTNAAMGAFDTGQFLDLPLFYVTSDSLNNPQSAWGDRVIWMNPWDPATGQLLDYGSPGPEVPVLASVTEALSIFGKVDLRTSQSPTPTNGPTPLAINTKIQIILTSPSLRAKILSSGVFSQYELSDPKLLQAILDTV